MKHLEEPMAKAYWIGCYRSISNPDALAAYAKLAGPAIAAAGGKFLARGGTAKTYEAGIDQRTVLIEFASVAQAIAAHDSPGYQAALAALGNGAERDIRIVEGLE
jgi:uncharacterized protein (DUF1330 family)